MRIKDLITSRVCGNTVFENSWIWYCDECRHHGTCTSSAEAEFMGEAHINYHSYEEIGLDNFDELNEDDDVKCYMDATEDERELLNWENLSCAVYIIDEGNNITYEIWDDYEDKTPNKVADIETMIRLQKDLGLD